MTLHFRERHGAAFAPLQKSRRSHLSYVLTEALSCMVFVPEQNLSGTVSTTIRYVTLHFGDQRGAASLHHRNFAEITIFISPGILSRKVGQPATNCKRRFFNGFWSRNMSSITYQKSPKIREGEVDEKRVFLEPYID